MRSKSLGFMLSFLVAGAAFAQEWPQWALNAQHNTQTSVLGQALNRNIVNIVYDPLVPAMQAQNDGELLAHYQAPLVDGNDTYMMFKSGTFTESDNSTQTWGETKYSWASVFAPADKVSAVLRNSVVGFPCSIRSTADLHGFRLHARGVVKPTCFHPRPSRCAY